MNVDDLGCITPEKLQDFITCPLLFKIKYMDKTPLPLTSKEWCNRNIIESFHEFVTYHKCRDTEEIKLPNSYTTVMVNQFTNRFNHPVDASGKEFPLQWKSNTPEKSHHYGTNCVHLIANHPKLLTMQISQSEVVIDLHLRTDSVHNTYIPCSVPTASSFFIRCCLDGILADQSILHFSSSSRSKVLDHFASKIYFSLLSLAKNQLSGYSLHHENQFTIFNLIQSNDPKIQWLTLEKRKNDHDFALKFIFDCFHQINHSMFQPRENCSCLSSCSYKRYCGLFPNSERR